MYISRPIYLEQGQGDSHICVGKIQELMQTSLDKVPRAGNYILLQPLLKSVGGTFGIGEKYLRPL